MTSRNRHLFLEQPFEELPQRRPRCPPAEHNVLKTRATASMSGCSGEPFSSSTTTTPRVHERGPLPSFTADHRSAQMSLPAEGRDEVPGSVNTSTSICVLNIRRDGETHTTTMTTTPTSPSPASPGDDQPSTSQLTPPPPAHSVAQFGRRSAEPHGGANHRSDGDPCVRSTPRLHLDFEAPASLSAASVGRSPVSQVPAHTTNTAAPVKDPHEAAVAALRLREHPTRLTSRTGGAVGVPPRRSSSKTGLPPRHLPAAQEKQWLQGLDHVVTGVWAPLGLLTLPPPPLLRSSSSQASDEKAADADLVPPITVEDQALFVTQLRFYFAAGGRGLERVACTSNSLGNALWYVVFNTVYYCVGVLGSAYTPVRSSDQSGSLPTDIDAPALLALTPLVWRGGQSTAVHFPHSCAHLHDGVPASLGEHLRELARQVRPAPESRRRADAESSIVTEEAGASSVWSTEAGEEADPTQYINAFSEAAPFSAADWLFVVRYMASIGYQRDAFYLQTPTSASPQELVLALLWLTKTYQLLAVAEYVELNVRFPFLLAHHTDPAEMGVRVTNAADGATRGHAKEKQDGGAKLLFSFPNSSAWPPASFDESQAIDRRLHMLQRLLGGNSESAANTVKAGARVLLRRLLAVRRQIDLSLSRVEKAMHQRTDQIRFLGLHSPLDVQLCLPEFDAAYHWLLASLKHVRGMEERVRVRVGHLTAAGDLVAYALHHHRTTSVPAKSAVLEGLEEDAATWLNALRGTDTPPSESHAGQEGRHAGAVSLGALPLAAADLLDGSRLGTALSKFRVTRTKQYLADLWRSLSRRAQIDTAPPPPSQRTRGQAPGHALAADPHAQRAHKGHVKRSLTTRYSLQAALAAEVLLLRRGEADVVAVPQGISRGGRAGHFAGDEREGSDPLFSLEALPLELTCCAIAQYQQLLHRTRGASDAAQAEDTDVVPPLAASSYQLTEVGLPAAAATTSARLEMRRLTTLLEQIEASIAEHSTAGQRGDAAVSTLHNVYRLRPARTIKVMK